ncbi:hypothetical protein NPIL_606941 [Nephila pilipes]|uniref:Uncharacterized protein n=1 Tax=Nephila pilipes TaxID=299642 RepID=A0A8X6QDH6_NEPPI|nr:hypothetical protein NPIL_606941 [Nephila pilipes]
MFRARWRKCGRIAWLCCSGAGKRQPRCQQAVRTAAMRFGGFACVRRRRFWLFYDGPCSCQSARVTSVRCCVCEGAALAMFVANGFCYVWWKKCLASMLQFRGGFCAWRPAMKHIRAV